MDSPKPNQHFRISLEQAKRDYQDGIITAAGLIYYAIGIYRKPGDKLKIPNVDSFCQLLGIASSTFYKVVSKLRVQGRLNWEATDGVNVWLLEEPQVIQLISSRACQSPIVESESPIVESESPIVESESPIVESESPIGEFRASKPALCNASSPSSDSYQIFFNSLSDSEREKFKEFVDRKIELLPYKIALRQKWIKKNFAELEAEFRETVGNRRSINLPNLEQMARLQQMKDSREIRNFGLEPYKNGQTIVVDDFSEALPWWEFFNSRDFND